MEGVLILLGILAALAAPVLAIIALAAVGRLKNRLDLLEARLEAMAAARIPQAPPPPQPTRPAPATTPAAPDAAQPATAEALPIRPAPAAPAGAGQPAPAPAAPHRPPRAALWLRDNWIYVVSAVSLGLAGIFLVQYGIERGLISPGLRVLAALGFGAALVTAGERIRRRSGDGEDRATAYLPSVFASAGVVVLYAAILAARGLYGLIGPQVAFGGLAAVSALAVGLGWSYGPFLAAAGLTGAAAAPFLVGGEAGSGWPFYAFHGLLAATGLAIDAMRRWGWVSALALGLAYLSGLAVFAAGGEATGLVALLAWAAVAAIALPRLEPWPTHPGPCLAEAALAKGALRPIPPVVIAAAAVAVSSLLLVIAPLGTGPLPEALAFAALAGLAAAPATWAWRAPGLADLAAIPAGAFLALVVVQAFRPGDLFAAHALFLPGADPEASPPATVALIAGLAAAVSAAAAWRGFRRPFAAAWAAASAAFAPAALIALELFWQPAAKIGAWPWAGHAIALAGFMTLLAGRFAQAEGADRRRSAYAALAALTLIALALFTLLSGEALTVALAVLVAAAAALDRRFGLPELGLFLAAGVLTLGWRLILDPGLPAYLETVPIATACLAFGAALAGLGLARAALPEDRPRSRAMLDAGLWSFGGIFAVVLIWRGAAEIAPDEGLAHWSASLLGLAWLASALGQLYRATASGRLLWVGRILAAVFGLLAALSFLVALTILNPSSSPWVPPPRGLAPADTLTVAYLLPAAVFGTIARHAGWLRWRTAFAWAAGLFAALWAFLEIRWFWRGAEIADGTFTQPELYSYTVALLIAGGGLLYQALARRSALLRRVAMTVIALTVAKVFLIDASGLTGLLRVFSFLALGLALAGLAWLNRWAAGRQAAPGGPDP
ncbi:MAG: DUF2339 domain-containing protein [Rhodobacteraceae bacterium]|nr:DUF2339 domain-containing protein [Paracoccaceae bacterium]